MQAVPEEAERCHEEGEEGIPDREADGDRRDEEANAGDRELHAQDAGHMAVGGRRQGLNHAILSGLREGDDAEAGKNAGQHKAKADAGHRVGGVLHGERLGPAGDDAQEVQHAIDGGEGTDVRILQNLELPFLRCITVKGILGIEIAVKVDAASEKNREQSEDASDEKGVELEIREKCPDERTESGEDDAHEGKEAHRILHAALVPVRLWGRDAGIGGKGNFQ